MKISYDDFGKIREQYRDKTIVLCTGGFDLTHAGHLLFFEDCKQRGDILVVGVASDATRRKERGPGRPILNEHLRLAMVDGLKPVDFSFLITELARPDEYPHRPLATIFQKLRPDMYVVNEDISDRETKKKFIESCGVRFVVSQRVCPPEFERVSTTGILERIENKKRDQVVPPDGRVTE